MLNLFYLATSAFSFVNPFLKRVERFIGWVSQSNTFESCPLNALMSIISKSWTTSLLELLSRHLHSFDAVANLLKCDISSEVWTFMFRLDVDAER